jgi:hypothetical protein
MCYFPQATQLTLEDGLHISQHSFAASLTRFMPLEQLKTLLIECKHLSFVKLVKLLALLPNVETLRFQSMPFYRDSRISIEQSESFRLVSKGNLITSVTVKDRCTLEKVEVLLALCPRVQHLEITSLMEDMDVLLQFLLNPASLSTSHLISLRFLRASRCYVRHLYQLMAFGKFHRDCMVKHIESTIYLWW